MVHYAGYCPRFHPSDFEVRIARRGRRGLADPLPRPQAPLRAPGARTAGGRRLLAVGRPAPLPAHAASDRRRRRRGARGARKLGIEMRVGPVGITNGAFGNRPHCIYRGYCLQGCKVNAKASPLVTHIPDAIEHGAEIRAHCMAAGSCSTRRPARDRGALPARRLRALPAGRRRRGGGLFDRDAAAAAELDQPPVPPRPGEQQRPGRAVRDGAGCAAGGRPVPR